MYFGSSNIIVYDYLFRGEASRYNNLVEHKLVYKVETVLNGIKIHVFEMIDNNSTGDMEMHLKISEYVVILEMAISTGKLYIRRTFEKEQ